VDVPDATRPDWASGQLDHHVATATDPHERPDDVHHDDHDHDNDDYDRAIEHLDELGLARGVADQHGLIEPVPKSRES
jgi:hypothetical protein